MTLKKTLIGWSEAVSFPDWKIPRILAKVDTGARTSALHVEDIKDLGDGRVRFHVVLNRKAPKKKIAVTAPIVKWGNVKSSTGEYAHRCFVRTRVRIGPVEKEVEVSLVCRRRMMFRMLLGRKALERDFIVDVSRRQLLDGKEKKNKKIKKKDES